MIKNILFLFFFFWVYVNSYAVNLLQVYEQALSNDPTYQEALAKKLSAEEGVPINLSALLPQASLLASPFISQSSNSWPATSGSNSNRGYNFSLLLSQSLFDFGKYAGYKIAKTHSQEADAAFNQATQELMLRVAKNYFNILEDEDNLRYIKTTRDVYTKQFEQVRQQYEVGLKTRTDVYTAEASYQGAVADCIAAENQLANDKENLRAITGSLYSSFARLRRDFPLVKPVPSKVEEWVETSAKQNWAVKTAQYAAKAAKENIKKQYAGHLPTLNVEGQYNINRNSANDLTLSSTGGAQLHQSIVTLNLNIPLVQGGLVTANTKQAQYNYQAATQLLEKQLREAINLTRQSYLGVILGISKINADKKTIRASISSYNGMEAGYKVGTEILVNVLDQQQKVVEAKKQYASDRYQYVNSLLSLKQAAGTLSPNDLMAINAWLEEPKNN